CARDLMYYGSSYGFDYW
nr:immunoglobulin heavy chain junction region [Mus musculus]MBK4195175.1 immunoglobulin heavy chain junction region [Mus musculus]